MTWLKSIFCALMASSVLAACSGPTPEQIDASLKTATATALPDAKDQTIEVTNSERLSSKWRWTAKVGGKVYTCDADDQMRLPSCETEA